MSRYRVNTINLKRFILDKHESNIVIVKGVLNPSFRPFSFLLKKSKSFQRILI